MMEIQRVLTEIIVTVEQVYELFTVLFLTLFY